MRFFLGLAILHIALVGTHVWASSHYRDEMEDSEFAEFEDFEEDEGAPVESNVSPQSMDSGDATSQDDEEIAVVEVQNCLTTAKLTYLVGFGLFFDYSLT